MGTHDSFSLTCDGLNPSRINRFLVVHYSAVRNDASLYIFVIVDDYSRYTWVHIVTYKHEV